MRLHRRQDLNAFSKRVPLLALLVASIFLLPGCAVIESIFKAGVWVGILAVVAVIAIAGGLVAMLRK